VRNARCQSYIPDQLCGCVRYTLCGCAAAAAPHRAAAAPVAHRPLMVPNLSSALKLWAAKSVTPPRAHSPSRSPFYISGSIISHSEIVFLSRLFPTRLPPIVVVQLLFDILIIIFTFLFFFVMLVHFCVMSVTFLVLHRTAD
jgi:hypothetical protein